MINKYNIFMEDMGVYNIPIRLLFKKGFGFNIVDLDKISDNTYLEYKDKFNDIIFNDYKKRIIYTIEALSNNISIIVNKGNDFLYGYKEELFELLLNRKYIRIDLFYKGRLSFINIYRRVRKIIKVNIFKYIYYYFLSKVICIYIKSNKDIKIDYDYLERVTNYRSFIMFYLHQKYIIK